MDIEQYKKENPEKVFFLTDEQIRELITPCVEPLLPQPTFTSIKTEAKEFDGPEYIPATENIPKVKPPIEFKIGDFIRTKKDSGWRKSFPAVYRIKSINKRVPKNGGDVYIVSDKAQPNDLIGFRYDEIELAKTYFQVGDIVTTINASYTGIYMIKEIEENNITIRTSSNTTAVFSEEALILWSRPNG